MPVTIKSSQIKVKGTDGYVGVDALADSTTASRVAAINSAGASALEDIQSEGQSNVSAIEQKGAEVLESIPDEYTQLENDVSELKSALFKALHLNLIPNSYWTVSGTPIGAPVTYNGWSRTDRLPCTPGETLKITGTVRSQYNIFFNTDTDGDINQAFTVQVGDNTFVVPQGAYYFALSNTTAGMQGTVVKRFLDVEDIAPQTDVDRVETQADNLESHVNFVFTETDLYKPVDLTNETTGYYISSTGEYSENAAFNLVDNITLKKGQTIHIRLRGTTTVATLAQALGNDVYIPLLLGQGGSAVAEQEYTADSDMTVVISYSKNYERSAYVFTNVIGSGDNDKSFYCTPQTGFYNALNAIRQDASTGTRILYVFPGEYDLYTEIGGDTYAAACIPDSSFNPPAAAWKHFSVVCPDRLKIIGLGDVVLKFNIPDNTWPTGAIPNSVLSPISLRYGCEIENIRIECSNTRYGIHIEGSGEEAYRNVRYILKNVSIIYTLTDNGYASAIGCGLNSGTSLEVDGCVLKVIGSTGNGIKGHLNDGTANIYVNNSFLDAPLTGFNVEWNTKGKTSRFRFVNDIIESIVMSNGNLATVPFVITYEMIKTDTHLERPSDTTVTMPIIENYGSVLTIDQW